ncbi:MAG: hypothetical protein IH911_08520 [Proteobacteria bacterium]|nr:hypothetical protein [Pseudomonadota bacterium]
MPELPDIDVYVTALERHILGHKLLTIRFGNAFLLRSVSPSPSTIHGEVVAAVHRIGKRIAIGFENDIWLVIHLMVAGRLHWKAAQTSLRGKHALDDDQVLRLYQATVSILETWRERLMHDAGGTFPKKVTAFRDEMSVHGRFGKPCPACGEPIQRIRYKSNETNYCAQCQTGSRILKDRSLSRLLKQDWPKTLDEL